MKYVVIERDGMEMAVLVPEYLTHDLVASVPVLHRLKAHVVSAGFCELQPNGELRVFGESSTLGIKSRPQDAEVISETFLVNKIEVCDWVKRAGFFQQQAEENMRQLKELGEDGESWKQGGAI